MVLEAPLRCADEGALLEEERVCALPIFLEALERAELDGLLPAQSALSGMRRVFFMGFDHARSVRCMMHDCLTNPSQRLRP